MSYLPSREDASLIDVFRAWPALARPIHQFGETLMREDSPFEPGERELIASFVSALNGCEYCRGAHSRAAEHFGLDPKLVDQCVENIDSSDVAEKLKPVLHYCRKLNDRPGSKSAGKTRRRYSTRAGTRPRSATPHWSAASST